MRYLTRAVLLILMLAIAGGLGACSKGSNASAEFGPGGTWIDDMRARVTEDIEDAETATALLVELDAIETELSAFDEKVIVFYEKLDALDRDYNTRRADYENAIEAFSTTRMATRDRIIDIRFRMRNLVTPDQWAVVADIDKSLLHEFQRGYQL
jgi:hypothetical protein